MVLDEAVAPEQLHAAGADLLALLGAQHARQVRLAVKRQPLLCAARGAPRQQAHRLDLDADVGDHERHRLSVRDRLAERVPIVAVRDRVVEHGLCDPDGQRAQPDAREVDQLGEVKRVERVTEQRVRGHADSVERQAAEPRGARAHRGLTGDGQPRGARLDDERARPLARDAGRHDEQLRGVDEGHEGLVAAEHEAGGVAHRARRQHARIEERPRLRDGERGLRRVGLQEGRQVPRLLRRRAPPRQRVDDPERRQRGEREARVAARELLRDERARDDRRLGGGAAQPLGDRQRRQAELVELRAQVRRRRARPVGGGRGGAEDPPREALGHLAHHLLLLGQTQIEQLALRDRADALRARQRLRGLEAARRRPARAKALAHDAAREPLRRRVQAELVDPRRAREVLERRQRGGEGVHLHGVGPRG